MAYKKRTKKILAGSLNHLPPGDLIPPEDALALTNFRADQAGILRSRGRETAVTAALDKPIRTLFLQNVLTPRKYQGGGNRLYRNGASISAGFDGEPIGLVNFADFTWVMNRSMQGKDDGTSFLNWLPAKPTAAPTVAVGAANGPTGTYTYYYTYDTAAGHESDLSPVSGSVTVSNQKVDLSGVTVSLDAQVTKRHIYRSGGTQDQLYRVGTINDNTTTTFTDSKTDTDAATDGITHTADHDPPPAARGLVGPYYDKLIAFNSAADPNKFWWTPTNKPWYFPGSGDAAGNHAPAGEEGDGIVAISLRPRVAIMYKGRSIWRLTGDPDTEANNLEQTSAEVGLVGARAWCQVGPVDYFLAQDGLYVFNGDRARKISQKLDPIFKGEYVTWTGADPASPMNASSTIRAKSSLAYRQGKLYLSYADDNHAEPNTTLVYEIESQRWYRDDRAFSALYNEGEYGDLLGAIGDKVYSLEESGSSSLSLVYHSGYDDQGLPENLKGYGEVEIEHDTAGASLAVSFYYDHGASNEALGNISSSGRATTKLKVSGVSHEARNLAVRIAGNATGEVKIYGVTIHYYVGPRQALTFDTGPTNLGSEKHKEVSQLAIPVDNAGVITWTLYSDSGGALAQVETGTIAAGDRRVAYIPLTATRLGKMWRLTLSADSIFELWAPIGFFARVIGQFLPAGAELSLPATDFGTRRVKLTKKIEVDLDGALSLKTSTDLPGAAIAERDTGIIAATGGRQKKEIKLPANTRGTLIQSHFEASADTRIYGARVYAKPLGEARKSAWDWYPLPIEPTPAAFTWVEVAADE